MARTTRPLIAILAVPWAIGAIFMAAHAIYDFHVSSRQQLAEAVVVAHPNIHGSFEARVSLGGVDHVGTVYPHDEALSIGQRVRVYLDPTEPTYMSLESFSALAARDAAPIPVLLIGIATIMVFSLRVGRRSDQSD